MKTLSCQDKYTRSDYEINERNEKRVSLEELNSFTSFFSYMEESSRMKAFDNRIINGDLSSVEDDKLTSVLGTKLLPCFVEKVICPVFGLTGFP